MRDNAYEGGFVSSRVLLTPNVKTSFQKSDSFILPIVHVINSLKTLR